MNELERARAKKEQALKEKREHWIGLLILVGAFVVLFFVVHLYGTGKGGQDECVNSSLYPAC